ncbi:MAG: class I SAM-dependent methyltransferase [Candidatus Omnitrophota bacterium]
MKDQKRCTEYVKCDICGLAENILKFKKDGFGIVQCKGCGLIYVNPRLEKDALKKMYADEISPVQQYEETLHDDEKTFHDRIRILKKFVKTDNPKVLDLGCSVGTLLKELKKEGWEAEGIDVDKSAEKYWKAFEINAICADFEEVKLARGAFDLIIMNDFVEHTTSPVSVLKKANFCLKKSGILFISTPDAGSMLSKMSKSRWLHLKPREHLYYFEKDTINKALKKCGFRILWCGSIGRVRNLKTVFFKSQVYTNFFCNVVKKLKIGGIIERIAFNVNLGDEMGVIAEKEN